MREEKEEKKEMEICPYLETSHSRAILYYSCLAVEGEELRVKPEDIRHYPCFTLKYRNCKKYKESNKVRGHLDTEDGKCKK